MTNFKPKCGYLGCDPVVGQCLGFCEYAKDHTFVDAPSVDDESEDGSMEMLAWLIVLVIAIGCFVIWGFA